MFLLIDDGCVVKWTGGLDDDNKIGRFERMPCQSELVDCVAKEMQCAE